MDIHTPQLPQSYLDESRVPTVIIINATLQVFSTTFVLARLYSRAVISRTVRTDDYLLIAAWSLSTGLSVTNYLQVAHGLGRHLLAVDVNQSVALTFGVWLNVLFYAAAITMAKVSVCALYFRIFRREVGIVYYPLIMVMIVIIANGFFLFFFNLFLCKPIELFWRRTSRFDPRCKDSRVAFYFCGSLTIATDVAVICLVSPPIWKLKMPPRQRAALLAVVSIGWLSVIACLVRMIRTSAILYESDDIAWSNSELVSWIAVEVHFCVFCAAAPAIKPVIQKILPRLWGSLNKSGKSKGATTPGTGEKSMNKTLQGTNRMTAVISHSENNLLRDSMELDRENRDSDVERQGSSSFLEEVEQRSGQPRVGAHEQD